MEYTKLVSISAAVLLTTGVFGLVASPAHSKAGAVFVVANPNVVTRHVSFSDLNLASAAGEQTLNNRVVGVVRSLCDETTGGLDGNYITANFYAKCRRSAWAQARPQIALATQRAREIASTGTSPIAGAAITVVLTK